MFQHRLAIKRVMRTATTLPQIALATVVFLAACGDASTGPAIERNNAGTGTSTLLVTADVEAADAIGGFITDFNVSVRDAADNPVSGATVTISNSVFSAVALLETGVGSGDYAATRTSFPGGDFALTVVRGADNVREVVLGGPGIHTITDPAVNATVSAQQDLTIRWTVPSRAKSAELETRDFESTILPDAGAFVVPAAENAARSDQRIRVYRFNEVDIAGGLPGSRMRVKIRRTLEPIIVQ